MILKPEQKAKVQALFDSAVFVKHLGATILNVEPGSCEIGLNVTPDHHQQNGFVHAGVLATLADHAAGGAAASVCAPGTTILTAEFKISFLRPAPAKRLRCVSRVLKPGRTLTVCESEVYALKGKEEILAAKAMVTLAVVSEKDL